MTIRDVRIYLVDARIELPKQFIFCRLEAGDGTVGWGEAYTIPRRERGIAEFVKSLGEMLMSLENPTPQSFRNMVSGRFDKGHFSIDLSSAVSGLEVALWDIEGKRAKKPLCELLGPALTRSIPLYANMESLTSDETIDRLVERCVAARQQGFDAVKIYPMEHGSLAQAVECVRRVRHAIGSEAELLIDVWALEDPDDAIEAAQAFAAFDTYWFEEPVAGERIDDMARIRSLVDTPIVTGERQSGMHHFRSLLDKKAADILNPDILGAGGVQEIVDISQMAEIYGVQVSPHCWNSPLVGTAAMLHTVAVLPNFPIGEYFPHYAAFFVKFGELHIEIANGTAMIGDQAGLGVHMNEDALACHQI